MIRQYLLRFMHMYPHWFPHFVVYHPEIVLNVETLAEVNTDAWI